MKASLVSRSIRQRRGALVLCLLTVIGFAWAATGARAQTTREPQRGISPLGAYSGGSVDVISTSNGNLLLDIPLASLPSGRGGARGPSLHLYYNSKIWDPMPVSYPDPYNYTYMQTGTYIRSTQTGNWRYGVGYELQVVGRDSEGYSYGGYYGGSSCEAHNAKVRMKFPDGSIHEFRPLGELDERDGYFTLDPSGSRYYCTYYPPPPPDPYCQSAYCNPSGTYSLSRTSPTYVPRRYYTTDGTFLRLDVAWTAPDATGFRYMYWNLYTTDGTRVTTDPSVVPNRGQRVMDRNGNYYDVTNVTSAGGNPTTVITDQLGRTITVEHVVGQDYISTTGVGGEPLTWTVRWKTIRVYKNFWPGNYYGSGQSQNLNYSVQSVDQVILPQQLGGLSYTFDYNAPVDNGTAPTTPTVGWGELSSMLTPTGSRVNYTYRHDNVNGIPALDVMENYVSRKDVIYTNQYDGSAEQKTDTWLYQRGDGSLYYSSVGGMTITAPDGGVTVTNMLDAQFTNDPTKGLVYKTVRPDGSVAENLWSGNTPYELGNPYIKYNPFIKTQFLSLRDAQGNLVKTSIQDYSYDKNNNVTRVAEYDWVDYASVPRDANGRPTGVPAGAPLKRVTTKSYYNQSPDSSDTYTNSPNTYNRSGVQLLTAAAASQMSDGAQVLARQEYTYDNPNVTGNMTQQLSWDSAKGGYGVPLSSANSVVASFQYDQFGNVILSTDPRGVQTQYVYGYVGGATDLYPTQTKEAFNTAVQRTTTKEYDFYTGVVTRATDVDNNVSTAMSYDALGRPTLVRAAENRPEETRTSTTYSDAARRVVARTDLNATGDGALVSVQHFDQLGRLRLARTLEDPATQSVDDETAGIKVQTRYLYSGSNSYQLVSNPYRAATSAAAGAEGTMGWTRSKADQAGRAVEVSTFSGGGLPAPWGNNANSTGGATSTYDANYTTVQDQAGKVRRSVLDGLGRIVRMDEPDANNNLGSVSAPAQATSYAYDALGNLTQVNQGAQTRSFSYSSLSRLTAATNPESGTVSYQYDPGGNLQTKISPRLLADNQTHVTTVFDYDALSRLKTRTYNDGTPAVTYTYDTLPYGRGRLTSVSSGVSTTSYGEYDAMGRVKQSSQVTDGQTYPLSYTYNQAGSLKTETYPSGRVVTTAYDGAGRLAQVSGQKPGEANKTYVSQLAYTAHGAVRELKLGNNLWEHTVFNERLQPLLIGLGTSQSTPNPQDYNRFRVDYSYGTTDNNGNVRQQTVSVPDAAGNYVAQATQVYDYDQLNRLKSAVEVSGATQSWKQTYSYDRYGNRSFDAANTTYPSPPVNPAINQADNRFAANQGYGYDNAGNLTNAPGFAFAYDAENRMVGANDGQAYGSSVYAYDGDGRRVKKVTRSGTATAIFVYDVMGQMVAEYSAAAQQSAGGTSYLTEDNLGTPRVITDAGGAVKARHDYLPFGEEIGTIGGRTAQQGYVSDTVRQQFTQKERDAETGLDYFGARYYASAQGRFTSPDPLLSSGRLAQPASWNRYSYALNNPLRFIDPTGLYEYESSATKKQKERFEEQLKAAQKALDKIAKKYTMNSDEYRNAKRALDAYGVPNKANGVIVAFGTPKSGKPGETAGGTSLGQDITVTIDINNIKDNGDLATIIGHEGSHAQDRADFLSAFTAAYKADPTDAKGGLSAVISGPLNMTSNATETRAYGVSSVLAEFLLKNEVAPQSGGGVFVLSNKQYVQQSISLGGTQIWNPAWASADLNTVRQNRSNAIATGLSNDAYYSAQANKKFVE